MNKVYIFFFLMITLLLAGFTYDADFDYWQFAQSLDKSFNYENLTEKYVSVPTIDLVKQIKWKKLKLKQEEIVKYIPKYEEGLLQKYNNENLIKLDDVSNESLKVSIQEDPNSFIVSQDKSIPIIFYDSKKNIIQGGSWLAVFHHQTFEGKGLFSTFTLHDSSQNKTLLEVKGEWLVVIMWGTEQSSPPTIGYALIKRFNLKTKVVEVFDGYASGLISMFDVYAEGRISQYDLSKDRRYIYLQAYTADTVLLPGWDTMSKDMFNNLFKREPVKLQGGLYAFDWWEFKLYRLSDKNVQYLCNNLDYGKMYIGAIKGQDKKTGKNIYEYYSTNNLDTMLNELGKK